MASRPGDAAVSEVVGTTLMLTVTVMAAILLASASLDQARRTADYIRSLSPGGEERCVTMPDGEEWCQVGDSSDSADPPATSRDDGDRGLPPPSSPESQSQVVGSVCVRDSLGQVWCLKGHGARPDAGVP